MTRVARFFRTHWDDVVLWWNYRRYMREFDKAIQELKELNEKAEIALRH